MSQTRLSSIFKSIKKIIVIVIFGLLAGSQLAVSALPATFDQSEVLTDSDLYGLPDKFSSAAKIQDFLVKNGSFLANYKVSVSFENDDPLLISNSAPANLRPNKVLSETLNKEVLVSDLIWNLSQTSWANGCSLSDRDVCFDNSVNPINPAFLLTIIQKESGLIYGSNGKLDPSSDQAKFLLERATGYMCLERERKSSCFDENPSWKYYKGLFRQVYFASRLLRLVARRCVLGGRYVQTSESNIYTVGNTVKVDGQNVLLKNDITCSFYVYTPHVVAQRLVYNVFKQLGGDQNLSVINSAPTPIPTSVPVANSSAASSVANKTPDPVEIARIENSIPESLKPAPKVIVASSSSSSKPPEFKNPKVDLVGVVIMDTKYSQDTILRIVDKSRRLKF